MATTTKIVKAAKLREVSKEELSMQLADAKKDLFGLRVKSTTKELTQLADIRKKRREIARLNTVLAEKAKAGSR
jgi:large subunit ribosomal protein L29